MVDFTSIKVGDEITVRMKVVAKGKETVFARSKNHLEGTVAAEEIDTRTPAQPDFALGSQVTFWDAAFDRRRVGKLIAKDGDFAWVQLSYSNLTCARVSVPLSALQPCE